MQPKWVLSKDHWHACTATLVFGFISEVVAIMAFEEYHYYGVLVIYLQDTDPGLVIVEATTVSTARALNRLRQLVSCEENPTQLQMESTK